MHNLDIQLVTISVFSNAKINTMQIVYFALLGDETQTQLAAPQRLRL